MAAIDCKRLIWCRLKGGVKPCFSRLAMAGGRECASPAARNLTGICDAHIMDNEIKPDSGQFVQRRFPVRRALFENQLMSNATTVRYFRPATGLIRHTETALDNLALDVLDALPNHPIFNQLPVSLADLAGYQASFSAARVEAHKGGKDRTLVKKAARHTLQDALVKIGLYCRGVASHNLAALLTSGFAVVSTNHRSRPLATPAIIALINAVSGRLTVRGQAVLNGRMYKIRTSTDGGLTWTEWPVFTGARLMVLAPTVPGTIYMVEFCALGGSTGQSPWSNPVTIMST